MNSLTEILLVIIEFSSPKLFWIYKFAIIIFIKKIS